MLKDGLFSEKFTFSKGPRGSPPVKPSQILSQNMVILLSVVQFSVRGLSYLGMPFLHSPFSAPLISFIKRVKALRAHPYLVVHDRRMKGGQSDIRDKIENRQRE